MQIRAYPNSSYSCDFALQSRVNEIVARKNRFTRYATGLSILLLATALLTGFLRLDAVSLGCVALLAISWAVAYFFLASPGIRSQCPHCHKRFKSVWVRDEEFLVCENCHQYVFTHRRTVA
ncbi:MAG TPA: hypothetical protein VIS74_08190 [Chthoniobacterales bacterium]